MVWVILLAGAVACSGRQIRTDQDLETAAKQAAAGKESGWQSLEGTVRNNGDDQDLEYQKRALTEIGKIQSPRGELILKENLTHRQLRGEAAQGLIHQRNEANKSQIDAALVESADKNAREYGGLTREEIKALGETDHPDAVRLLKQQIGRDPNKDELTVEALGKILKRRSKSHYHPLNFTLPIGAKLEIDTIMSSEDKKEEKTEAKNAETDPEKVLLDYLAGNGTADVKDKAAQSIAEAHPPGVSYLIMLAGRTNVPVKSRIAIVDYLTRVAVNAQDRKMIPAFYGLRKRANHPELVASIDLSLRVLGNAFGRPVTVTRTTRVVQSDGFEPLAKEADIISLKQRPYPEYSAADVKTNLRKALKYYRLDSRLADRMQSHVNDLLNLPEKSQVAERNLIFSALSRLYPAQDFYVLKKQGQEAFAKPGYFTTTLRLITSSARGRSWQIAALQRVWGLTYNEADIIRQIYLRDGKLLQQRMRL